MTRPISYAELLERQISAPRPGLADQIAALDHEISLLLELQRTRQALQRALLNGDDGHPRRTKEHA